MYKHNIYYFSDKIMETIMKFYDYCERLDFDDYFALNYKQQKQIEEEYFYRVRYLFDKRSPKKILESIISLFFKQKF